jgi:DNA-binding transcriptional MerR regulator
VDADELRMTVDEVAREAGTTTRNVRNYQTKGLLDPPTVVGRVGHYGRAHLSRLKLIARLQERGYSLAAIGDLIRAFEERQTVGEMLGLQRELAARVPEEQEQILSRSELVERFPMLDGNLELVASVVDLELVVPLPPERRGRPEQYRVPSPKLLEIGGELLDAGVPVEVALQELEHLRNDARRIAGRLVDMFTRHVWDPWVEAGHPVDAVPQMVERIRRLKPLPVAAMDSVLAHALDREIGRVVAHKLAELQRFQAGIDDSEPEGS